MGDELSYQYDLFVSAQVVGASSGGIVAPEPLVRKANAAIHIFPVKGSYSLVMRRLFNALLALSHAKLDSMPAGTYDELVAADKVLRFETTTADLLGLIGWDDGNNYPAIYAALDALLSLHVVWDYTDLDNNDKWRHKAPLLSQWGRSETGKVAWLWVPDLFRLLFDPKRSYTPVDIALSLQFKSRYTLAVYENVFRYQRMKPRQTPWRPVEDWRLLFAGPGVCKEYREFKRQVLTVALNEIRDTPTCPVYFELEEQKGACNRVNRLCFHIKTKPQYALDMDLPAMNNPALRERMQRLGVTPDTVNDLLARYDEPHLLRAMLDTERKVKSAADHAPIRSPAGYFIRRLERERRDTAESQELNDGQNLAGLKQAEAEELAQARWNRFKADEAERWFNEQPPERQRELHATCYAQCGAIVRRSYDKHGPQNKLWRVAWTSWLMKQPGALSSRHALNFASFLIAHGTREVATT